MTLGYRRAAGIGGRCVGRVAVGVGVMGGMTVRPILYGSILSETKTKTKNPYKVTWNDVIRGGAEKGGREEIPPKKMGQ